MEFKGTKQFTEKYYSVSEIRDALKSWVLEEAGSFLSENNLDDFCEMHLQTDGEEGHANAQLIAAAPELLQALQHTIRELRKLNSIGSMPIIEQSEYIIAKSLGKEADDE